MESINIISDKTVIDLRGTAKIFPIYQKFSIYRKIVVMGVHRHFSVSNENTGHANNRYFHIDNYSMTPVSVPIRRIPLHKEGIVKELIKQYEELGLIQGVDSPFCAATVLAEKKNPVTVKRLRINIVDASIIDSLMIKFHFLHVPLHQQNIAWIYCLYSLVPSILTTGTIRYRVQIQRNMIRVLPRSRILSIHF